MTFGSTFGRTFSPTFQPSSQAEGNILMFYDDFTDDDGTALQDHVPVPINKPNNMWVQNATWGIYQNYAGKSGTGDFQYAIYDLGISNFQFEISFSGYYSAEQNHRSLGMIVRLTDINNFWFIRRYYNTYFQIVEVNSGVWTVRDTLTVSLPNRTWHTFTGTVSGTNITAYANGANMISYDSASFNQSATKIAMLCREAGYTDKYDNVKIWTL